MVTVLFSSSLFAAKIGDKRITVAYKDLNSGYSIIEVQEFVETVFERSRASQEWSAAEGAGGLYWGNPEEGFYKTYNNSISGSKSFEGEFSILAPSSGNFERTAEVTIYLL